MARQSRLFSSKDPAFPALFEKAGANAVRAAELLDQMLRDWPESVALAAKVRGVEQAGDRITHDILQRLNQTSLAPIDREDVIALSSSLDDIVDLTEEVADFMGLYRIEAPMDQSLELASVLLLATRQVHEALSRLRTHDDIDRITIEIHRLENEGDRIARQALASLFVGGTDPMLVIRWKDIFERLEEAIDATERVANVLQGIVIRNA